MTASAMTKNARNDEAGASPRSYRLGTIGMNATVHIFWGDSPICGWYRPNMRRQPVRFVDESTHLVTCGNCQKRMAKLGGAA